MVDENKNDEYHLSDNDLLGGGMESSTTPGGVEPPLEPVKPAHIGLNPAQRNAMLVLGFFIMMILLFKIYGHFSSKSAAKVQTKPAPVAKVVPTPAPMPVAPVTVVQPQVSPHLDAKIQSLSSANDGIRQDVNNIGSKVSGMQVNMQSMSEKVATLAATVDTLAAKLEAQTTTMQALELRLAQMAVKPKPHPLPKPKVLYYVQALIPGRAWLITADGAHTITVREGSPLQGYGTVQMIDTNQGKVMTTSGRTIKFSHRDF